MAKYAKGIETKGEILAAARKLFYSKGYENTTARNIAELSNHNLGLISYYFKSKSEIALEIYYGIAREIHELNKKNSNTYSIMTHVMSTLTEMHIALENENYRKFYLDISNEESVRVRYREWMQASLKTLPVTLDYEKSLLAMLCASALKAELISFVSGNQSLGLTHERIEMYYLEYCLHLLGQAPEQARGMLDEHFTYNIYITEDFQPIIEKKTEAY